MRGKSAFGDRLKADTMKALKKKGAVFFFVYAFAFVPIFPFFLINLLIGTDESFRRTRAV